MVCYDTWFEGKIADTLEAARNGDGCHPDEANALNDYLTGLVSARETARIITAPILVEKDPPQYLFRLWSQISEAMVELDEDDRRKIIDLLSRIKDLKPMTGVAWAELKGFASMWFDLYRLHMHGSGLRGGWSRDVDSFESFHSAMAQEYETVGRAEAGMFLQGLILRCWGYEVLNLVHREQPELGIYISQIFGWLDTAIDELKKYAMASPTIELYNNTENTLANHWATWKGALLRLCEDGSTLLNSERELAAQCRRLM